MQATSFLLCFHLFMYSGSIVCHFCKMSSEATPSNKHRTCIRFSYLAMNSCISKLHKILWRRKCPQCHGLPHPVSMTGLTTCISLSTVSFLALACSDLKTCGQCCSAACKRHDAAQMAQHDAKCCRESVTDLLTFHAVSLLSPTELHTTPSKSKAQTTFLLSISAGMQAYQTRPLQGFHVGVTKERSLAACRSLCMHSCIVVATHQTQKPLMLQHESPCSACQP